MNYICVQEGSYTFYFNKTNIAGISIDSNKPCELTILMIGDTASTLFTFSSQEERDKTMRDILSNERQTIVTADEGCDY